MPSSQIDAGLVRLRNQTLLRPTTLADRRGSDVPVEACKEGDETADALAECEVTVGDDALEGGDVDEAGANREP